MTSLVMLPLVLMSVLTVLAGDAKASTNLVPVTVLVRLDESVKYSNWIVALANDATADGPEYGSGTYTSMDANAVRRTTLHLEAGARYKFTMQEETGTGRHSFYRVFYGDAVFTDETELLRSPHLHDTILEETLFTVTLPDKTTVTTNQATASSSSSSTNPIVPSTSSISASTIENCVDNPEEAGDWIKNTPADRVNPFFHTTVVNDACTPHTSYESCTNEVAQDCQWVFLSASTRRGICRIDPISQCIGNGNCVCNTADFHGGDGTGILFHAPISVTARDIVHLDTTTFQEIYTTLPIDPNDPHPQDPYFFVSRTDFTARRILYTLGEDTSMNDKTVSFKIHFLYMDTPMVGTIFQGFGLIVAIDTANNAVSVNGHSYTLTIPLKVWTCTHVAITTTTLFVDNIAYDRVMEVTPLEPTADVELGPFSGELFDVRVYDRTLTTMDLYEVGARCSTDVNEPFTLQIAQDIDAWYHFRGCNPSWRLPGGEGGDLPTNGQQTYGSGPFATLWIAPQADPANPDEFVDVPEGEFDEEYYFQTNKLLQYSWERYLFEAGMIGFNQAPYRNWPGESSVPRWSKTVWNNPCKYMNELNNAWMFPIWNGAMGKWTAERYAPDDPNAVFDLRDLFYNRGHSWPGLTFILHEMFHGTQGSMVPTYGSPLSLWGAESTADFGPGFIFPASDTFLSPFTALPAYPMTMEPERDADRAGHFLADVLSIHGAMRGGHVYSSWLLWWFLQEHAHIPGIMGEMYALKDDLSGYYNGEILLIRIFVHRAGLDFGDVVATMWAHLQTWDLPLFAQEHAQEEAEDWVYFTKSLGLDESVTLESSRINVEIDPLTGTNGVLTPGPFELRPGPSASNCLRMKNVTANQYVTLDVVWDDNMGFDPLQEPPRLLTQHDGCDDDPRFYHSIVIAHNEVTGERRYWKLKGKDPAAITIQTSTTEPETLYLIMVPTPPADYVDGVYRRASGPDGRVSPIPAYSYRYSVSVSNTATDVPLAPPEEKEYGIIKFDTATEGFWNVNCTCLDDPSNPFHCIRPTFEAFGVTDPPVTAAPTVPGQAAPSVEPSTTYAPSLMPSLSVLPSFGIGLFPIAAPVSTDAPVTNAPVTNAPVTNAPVTNAPVTSAPSTLAPSSSPSSSPSMTVNPSSNPTNVPSKDPSASVTPSWSATPSLIPSTSAPSKFPSSSARPSFGVGLFPPIAPVFTPSPVSVAPNFQENHRVGVLTETGVLEPLRQTEPGLLQEEDDTQEGAE